MKTLNGFTAKTAQNLLLDAGAFFVNFDVTKDTYATAKTSGKLIGATQGGGSFNAVPNLRQIEVDGVRGAAKGLERNDKWDTSLAANVLEATRENIERALGLVTTTAQTISQKSYKKIAPKDDIDLTDYIDNITWVGTLSGSAEPVIIQVYNAINSSGLSLSFTDKGEAKIALNFIGHYDYSQSEDPNPPWTIYYPEAAA